MSWKLVGGSACVLAILAIFFLHSHKGEAPKPVSPVVFVPVPVAPPLPPEKPLPKKAVVRPPLKITPTLPAAPATKKQVDMSVSCRIARSMVAGKTDAQLKDMREKYHTTDEEIAQYKHCF